MGRKKRQSRERKRTDKQQNSKQKKKPAKSIPNATQSNAENKTEQSDPGSDTAKEQHHIEPRPVYLNWRAWRKIFVAVELLLAGAIAYFAWVQSDVSEGQLDAMISQNNEFIEQNKMFAQQTRELTRQNELIGEEIDLARESLQQNQEVLDQMRFEQRAWLSPGKATVKKCTANEDLSCSIRLKNTGLTPANITGIHIAMEPCKTSILDREYIETIRGRLPVLTDSLLVAPGQTVNVPFTSGILVTKEFIDGLADDSMRILLVGRVNYFDIAGKPRISRFCFINEADKFHDGSDLVLAHFGNEME